MIDVERYPGSKSIVGRIIRSPLRLIPKRTVMPILKGVLKGKWWITGSSIHRIWLGSYETSKMAVAAAWTTAGGTVFDIGANVGIYSILFSEHVGLQGHVIAFEPTPRNVSYLRRHLTLNRAANVSVVEAAVCATSGIASFDTGADFLTGRLAETGNISVRTTTIDAYIASSNHTPTLLKIDVEGGELEVLRGALKTLSRVQPRILLATHSEPLRDACVDLLVRSGYDVQELKDDTGFAQRHELIAVPCDGLCSE